MCASAAISSEVAGQMYGLEVLARCIEDKEDNDDDDSAA